MDKLNKSRKIWLFVFIASVILGIFGIAMSAFFAYKLMYFPMALSILLVANGFYGTPFYLIAYSNAKLRIRVLDAVLNGAKSVALLAEATGLREKYAERMMTYCIKHGLLGDVEPSANQIPVKADQT